MKTFTTKIVKIALGFTFAIVSKNSRAECKFWPNQPDRTQATIVRNVIVSQSIKMNCGTSNGKFKSLKISVQNVASGGLFTVRIYKGQSTDNANLLYTQNSIRIPWTNSAQQPVIALAGGTGSLDYTKDEVYTISLSSSNRWIWHYSSTGGPAERATNHAGVWNTTMDYFYEVGYESKTLAIGDTFQGGRVAYIYQSGDAGYVSGQTKVILAGTLNWRGSEHSVNWGCTNTTLNVTNKALGAGASNTTSIIAACSEAESAAKRADNYANDGFTDWYLPSYDELQKLFINKDKIGLSDPGVVYFWSSTEAPTFGAYALNFSSGEYEEVPKSGDYIVDMVAVRTVTLP